MKKETNGRLKLWWRAVRPFAYPASVVPSIVGVVIAWSEGFSIRIDFVILTFIGAVAAHTGANLLNDYIDFRRGVDRPGSLGGSGVLVEELLRPSSILIASVLAFAVAFAVALPLFVHVGWPLVWLALGGFVAGTGYVLPPFGFKYRALGDLTVFLAFGIGITLGAYLIQSGVFSWIPVFYAVPMGMLVVAILHANNIRDLSDDASASVKTLAGTLKGALGPQSVRVFYAILVLGAYVVLGFFIVRKEVTFYSIVAFATLPLAVRLSLNVLRAPVHEQRAMIMMDAKTAQLNLAFGLTLTAGVVLERLFGAGF